MNLQNNTLAAAIKGKQPLQDGRHGIVVQHLCFWIYACSAHTKDQNYARKYNLAEFQLPPTPRRHYKINTDFNTAALFLIERLQIVLFPLCWLLRTRLLATFRFLKATNVKKMLGPVEQTRILCIEFNTFFASVIQFEVRCQMAARTMR